MFRTRFVAVALSGALMLVSGCLQLGSGPGLFSRRPLMSDPCCENSGCGCGSSTALSQAPTVISDVPSYQLSPGQTIPPPRIISDPNSPMVPYRP